MPFGRLWHQPVGCARRRASDCVREPVPRRPSGSGLSVASAATRTHRRRSCGGQASWGRLAPSAAAKAPRNASEARQIASPNPQVPRCAQAAPPFCAPAVFVASSAVRAAMYRKKFPVEGTRSMTGEPVVFIGTETKEAAGKGSPHFGARHTNFCPCGKPPCAIARLVCCRCYARLVQGQAVLGAPAVRAQSCETRFSRRSRLHHDFCHS